jgi:hypothetical protein
VKVKELAVGDTPTQPYDESWLYLIKPESLHKEYMDAAIN